MEKGIVESFDKEKGYGFITLENGDKAFVHYSSIQTEGYQTLETNEHVSLIVADGAKGLVAVKVYKQEESD